MADSEIRQKKASLDPSIELRKADRRGKLLVSLPKWAAWAIIAWQIRLSIEVLVGKYAFPSLLTRFWRQASLWEVVCWGACILGLIFGLYSRYLLRKQLTQDLHRMDSIEKRLDALAVISGKTLGADDRSWT